MEIMQGCVALGGTITGEHGVGLEKIEAMNMVFSRDDLKIQRDLRLAFDPRELLNPGKILPGGLEEESLPTGEIQESGTPFDLDRVPESGEEACEMVRCAGLAGSPLLPLGKGRRRDFGNLSQGALTPLRSTGMAGIMENDPSNQFVTAEAGVELESLQDLLAAQGQWVALRPPLPGGCTVGGLTALGLSGPERLRYGAPRDQVLGLRFVSGKGRLINTGGKVVKNVAGYDLCRLLVGSAGTLGFITEVTWRLFSLPETCCAVHAEGSLEKVSACALDLLRSKTDPVFVAALGVADSEGEGRKPPGARRWCILIGYEGFSDFVKEQEVRCLSVFSRHGLKEEGVQAYPVRPGPFTAEYRKLHDLDYVLRIHLPLDRVPGWIRSGMEGLEAEHLLLDLGCGRIFAGLSSLSPDAWERLCRRAGTGWAVISCSSGPPDRSGRPTISSAPAGSSGTSRTGSRKHSTP